MLKNKVMGVILLVAVVFLSLINNQQKVSANDQKCIIGLNINQYIKEPKIENYIKGVDINLYFSTNQIEFIRKPDDINIEAWDTLNTYASGNLDNSKRNLKEGSYFTLDLPEGARLGGILDKRTAIADNIMIQDAETGNEVLFARAYYDYTTNRIMYFLTDYIEDKDYVQFEVEIPWGISEEYGQFNKGYEFTSRFADQVEATNTFNAFGRANIFDATQQNILTTKIININNDDKTYKMVGVFKVPNNYYIQNGFRVRYISKDQNSQKPHTPFSDEGTFRIYRVPTTYQLPDSFHFDVNEVVDITENMTKLTRPGEIEFKTTEALTPDDKYIFVFENKFLGTEDLIVSGFEINYKVDDADDFVPGGEGSQQSTDIRQLANAASVGNVPPKFCHNRIEIEKVDSETKQLLPHAIFSIRDASTGAVVDRVEVVDGYGVSVDLLLRDYIVVEEEAPEGYVLDPQEMVITLDKDDDQSVKITVENTKIPEIPAVPEEPQTPEVPETPKEKQELPKTGSDYKLVGCVAMSFLLAGAYVIQKENNS